MDSSAPHPSSGFCPVCHKNLKVIKASAQVTKGDQTYCSEICADLAETDNAQGKTGSRSPFSSPSIYKGSSHR